MTIRPTKMITTSTKHSKRCNDNDDVLQIPDIMTETLVHKNIITQSKIFLSTKVLFDFTLDTYYRSGGVAVVH